MRKIKEWGLWALAFVSFVGMMGTSEDLLLQILWSGGCILTFCLSVRGLDRMGCLKGLEE